MKTVNKQPASRALLAHATAASSGAGKAGKRPLPAGMGLRARQESVALPAPPGGAEPASRRTLACVTHPAPLNCACESFSKVPRKPGTGAVLLPLPPRRTERHGRSLPEVPTAAGFACSPFHSHYFCSPPPPDTISFSPAPTQDKAVISTAYANSAYALTSLFSSPGQAW